MSKFACFLLGLLVLVVTTAHADLYRKWGYVQARGQVLGPNDQPVLVEVDQQGNELQEVGEVYGPLEGVFMMSAFAYRTAVEQYNQLMQSQQNGVARGAVILSTYKGEGAQVSEYQSYCQGLPPVRVPAQTPDAQPVNKKIPCPPVDDTAVRSVVLRHPSTILDPDLLGEDGPILLRSPVDLRDRRDLSDNFKTVLLTPAGQIARQAQGGGMYENTVTYKWNYFQPDAEGNQPGFYGFTDDITDRVLSPLPGVKVSQTLSWFGFTQSDEDGKYRLEYYLPPCPCFTYDYNGKILGEVPYKNFNPKSKDKVPFGTYTVYSQTFDFCNGMAQCPLYPGFVQSAVAGIIATQATPMQPRQDLKVDAVMLTGEGRIDVPIGDTAYDQERAGFDVQNPDAQLAYDFDGDRQPDKAVLHNGQYYVYLGGRSPEYDPDNPTQPINEDLKRRPDYLPDFNDRGLLQSISFEDLEQTDLYVFRASTGQLILERLGLKQDEYVPYNGIGADTQSTDSANFYYKFLIRGPRGIADLLTGSLSDWWSNAGIKQELFEQNKADFLRSGEMVQIVAINRPTGYVGSVTAPLQLNNENAGRTTLDVPIDRLVLEPPNLKIRVERQTETQLGLTKGEINQYLIGSEGAGLQSDQYIKITSEWLNPDGTPLPEELPGYSGLLAKVVAPGQVAVDGACGSQASKIPIKPGFNLQLLKLNGDCDIRNEHYYVYVCGNNPDDTEGQANCFNFGTQSDGRPSRYVPVKVPVFDEIATRKLENAYRYARQDNLLLQGTEAPEPVHQWAYRPEMQFSVYELEQEALKLQLEREDGQVQTVNLQDIDPDLMSDIFAGEFDYVNFFYSLLGNENQRLETFGPSPALEFSLGEDQLSAQLTNEGQLQFAHLDHFAKLDSVDHLALRLYSNNDTANVLWEWVFGLKPLGGPNNVAISADDAQVELLVYLPGAGGKKEDGTEKKVKIQWSVQGPDGVLEHTQQTAADGIFSNTLVTSHVAGSSYTVTAKIIESDFEFYPVGNQVILGEYRVIPGEPKVVQLGSNSITLPADEVSTTTVQATIFDDHENRVSDGTQVALHVDGDADLVLGEQEIATANGVISFEVRSGVVVGSFGVELVAGETASQRVNITTTPITLQLNASTNTANAGGNQPITLTASVGGAADGTKVNWLATAGSVQGETTVTNGIATAILHPASEPSEGRVVVTVAGQTAMVPVAFTGTQTVFARLEHAAIVGDSAGDGAVSIEQWEVANQNYDYITHTSLEVHGPAGATVDMQIGTPNRPNAAPVAYFPMQGVADGATVSEDGELQAMITGSVLPANGALQFSGGHLLIQNQPALAIAENLFVNLNFEYEDATAIGGSGSFRSLITQGNSTDFAYRIGLIEEEGDTFLQADIATSAGITSLRHPEILEPERSYKAGLRYKDGLLELQLESPQALHTAEIQAVITSGVLQNVNTSIVVGRDYRGLIANLRIGQETPDRQLLAFDGDPSITFGADGQASISVRANANLGASPQQVGFAIGNSAALGHNDFQPLRIKQPTLAEEIVDLFIGSAHAQTGSFGIYGTRGLTVVSREAFGWFSSLGEKLAGAADAFVDVVKVGAEIVSIVVGLDDFIVLARTLISLGKDRDFLEYVEITFAAIGAIITVATVISAGSLAPLAIPLKQGLVAFKTAIKLIGPSGLKAAFGMAKGLGQLILEIIERPSVGLELAEDVVRTLLYLARDAGQQVIQLFVKTIHAPRDFINWVRMHKFFRRACDNPLVDNWQSSRFIGIAENFAQSPGKYIAAGVLGLFMSTANAAPPASCDALFEQAIRTADEIFVNRAAQQSARSMSQFTETMAEIQEQIIKNDGFGALALGNEAAEGIARMISRGRNATEVRGIMRDVIRTGRANGMSDAVMNQVINKYFRIIGEIDQLPIQIGNQLWGDLGKYLGNPGFIRGAFHQLDFINDLRTARKTVESIEEGFGFIKDSQNVKRRIDVVADSGRHFEVKNFSNYGKANVDTVINGLEKELGRILSDPRLAGNAQSMINEGLNKIHFVFRGSASVGGDLAAARSMLEAMRNKGNSVLGTISDDVIASRVRSHFNKQIDNALEALSTGKAIPDLGELVVFQGKTVPY